MKPCGLDIRDMVAIEPITTLNIGRFRSARLRALKDAPKAFGSTYEQESRLSDEQWFHRAARFNNRQSVGFLAVDTETACGIVRGTLDGRDSSVAWVESMWVSPAYRRHGVGRSLIQAVTAWALTRNVHTVKMDVTSHNESAIHFYRGLGFVPTGITHPYPNDPALVEYEMAQHIS